MRKITSRHLIADQPLDAGTDLDGGSDVDAGTDDAVDPPGGAALRAGRRVTRDRSRRSAPTYLGPLASGPP